MAFAKAVLTNGTEIKKAPIGFSWTTLFFGAFVGLFRSDWKWFWITLIISIITSGFYVIVASFIYNKMYINALLNKGYQFKSIEDVTENKLMDMLGRVSLPKTTDFTSK